MTKPKKYARVPVKWRREGGQIWRLVHGNEQLGGAMFDPNRPQDSPWGVWKGRQRFSYWCKHLNEAKAILERRCGVEYD